MSSVVCRLVVPANRNVPCVTSRRCGESGDDDVEAGRRPRDSYGAENGGGPRDDDRLVQLAIAVHRTSCGLKRSGQRDGAGCGSRLDTETRHTEDGLRLTRGYGELDGTSAGRELNRGIVGIIRRVRSEGQVRVPVTSTGYGDADGERDIRLLPRLRVLRNGQRKARDVGKLDLERIGRVGRFGASWPNPLLAQ